MPAATEKSSLKRSRHSVGDANDTKKPRRSARLSEANLEAHEDDDDNDKLQPITAKNGQLPSPLTGKDGTTEGSKAATISPPKNRNKDIQQRATPEASPIVSSQLYNAGLSSPPSDTQAFSQFVPPAPISYEVEDEEKEGVWGYLVPITGFSKPLVLKRRGACPLPSEHSGRKTDGREKVDKKRWSAGNEDASKAKPPASPAGGFLIGRHPECDRRINVPTVSNRHCLFFNETKDGETIAMLEDLSGNGTYVNNAYVGRNKRRQLRDGDEISILDQARFIFRYPRHTDSHGFRQAYAIQGQLGKGHFASVYLATEKSTGMRYAVKKFEKRSGPGARSQTDGLQQEIAVLMAVSHPNVLCLKDTFDETDGVYLVLELAPEGELFNWIVKKHKLSESETRKVFIQLFQGIKYLHDRSIVHRDIKPENILLLDSVLNVKLADFGLAKIIGEESFTTTLCGTPSYVAPEILEQSNHRRYTRAVDVWSLGVVLYICLCGFPPFSDELYTHDNPYTLSQQIKMGRFDYPSPYWDSVGDSALDLIDRMLTVDSDKRITIDECLEHPWVTQQPFNVTDSTDGLTGALAGLDFSRRKPVRERTLLSSINDIVVDRVIDTQSDLPPVKVFEKNPTSTVAKTAKTEKTHVEHTILEDGPDAKRSPDEFIQMGGKGDQVLYEGESRYAGDGSGSSAATTG